MSHIGKVLTKCASALHLTNDLLARGTLPTILEVKFKSIISRLPQGNEVC